MNLLQQKLGLGGMAMMNMVSGGGMGGLGNMMAQGMGGGRGLGTLGNLMG